MGSIRRCSRTQAATSLRDGRNDDDKGEDAVVYFGELIHSGNVLPMQREHLTTATSLEHEWWKRAHPECYRNFGIAQ